MTDIHAVLDAITRAGRSTRESYHLTLGQAIRALDATPPETAVFTLSGGAPGRAHSYRGYYEDLSLEPGGDLNTAGKLLAELRRALGNTFTGWKGGDFVMTENTPLWLALKGCTGPAITELSETPDGLLLRTRDVD